MAITHLATSHRERLAFLQIDAATTAALVDFRPHVEAALPGIMDKFYRHLMQQPLLAKLFPSEQVLSHARSAQAKHWLVMFEGKFDEAYVESTHRIGKAHERIGLEPRWYIGGYGLVLAELMALAVATYRRKPEKLVACQQAITKALMLDMDYAISVYIEEGKATFNSRLNSLAENLETSVKAVVEKVSVSATQMRGAAESMAAQAQQTSQQATTVATASEQASVNVQAVASATEELNSSVAEISRQVSQSSQITGAAVTEANTTNAKVEGLAAAAQRIGDVVKLISDIASQTNLLALNATIEAARAGEAGKGFAVVAAEVKNLANQTARATEEITSQVANIQGATKDAVDAIQRIGATIGQINEISTAIASAVEQQGAATREIAQNVQQAAAGTGEVSNNIMLVTRTAEETGRTAANLRDGSSQLTQHSDSLKAEVEAFVSRIRAA